MSAPYVFAGGVAVVTGAAGGIGEALAVALAARGSHLALIDRDGPGLEGVAQGLRTRHPGLRLSTHTFDLVRTAEIPGLADEVLRHHGRVNLLINNAGIALGGTFEQITLEQFERVQAINLRAVVALCKALLPALKSSLGSQIVNVSSLYGLIAPAGQTAYSASKFAVRGFSEALRHELAPLGLGVTVVHPGGVRTRIASSAELAPGLDAAEVAAQQRQMERLLTLPPAQAATIILDAVHRRAPRVLVGGDARMVDLLARLFPGHYWRVVSWLTARLARG
ncbi:SDR family NAD(P)-dependent oxidoreductase [Deinococcus koreensis]|uniref:Acetoin dehydrogenase n=1 Tax=Deinococcus koreensis TaxID=2054903 RepID=A0A2K3USG3_9DEIO|nr:SDR family NAD(P)-dependent oxidoreductase [Deinococcus koreensis]PNY79464.1 acetoin dehydrogenase [Deinococcus koreensis]